MRRPYRTAGLVESELAPDPFTQFSRWFAAAAADPALPEPNAMVLATADADGRPSARTVLLKAWDLRGFVLFTNYRSRKGTELDANPRASLVFSWHPIARQIVVNGDVTRTSGEETAEYFASRPRGSRLGAWASEQSAPLASREELERRYAELDAAYPGEVPVPPFWGGYRVRPLSVEFWQGRPDRLHDRLVYRRAPDAPDDAPWTLERLNP
ncbi:pyridoxamine 5'-phosphate oxidase [Mangrovactinospora gilvigrisea]|uniref:Pyridoxine/pyridoxamine 5'-phosphate oxidase n=1 Tax=Mangrovactinospora gilvigrisea TaxID=1428644 RepID=A0A1J7CGI9_9ACTN|nr:pyridoxamine 5'-phosphate oxidase [Mangrovactinospora gilvigrisea]OIV38778.1 pyridoxamine 5'-phosphate oxidase [Mangrovactinospora gilvigrisea]